MTENIIKFFFPVNFIEYPTSVVFFKEDAPLPWQMNFQQPATPTMEGIIDLHHNIMFFMIFIVIFVSFILLRAVHLFNEYRIDRDPVSRTRHYLSLEIIWTILPLVILFWIALPSFALLYSIDHCSKVELTIKVIGRQWYWSYEIDTYVPVRNPLRTKKVSYNNFLSNENNIKLRSFRNYLLIGDVSFKTMQELVQNWIMSANIPRYEKITVSVCKSIGLDIINTVIRLPSLEEWNSTHIQQREAFIAAINPDLLTENTEDISVIIPQKCGADKTTGICVPGVLMPRVEAVKYLAVSLGVDIVKPDVTPAEFVEILPTIPEEKLLEAVTYLGRRCGKNYSDIEPFINLAGGIKGWLHRWVLNVPFTVQEVINMNRAVESVAQIHGISVRNGWKAFIVDLPQFLRWYYLKDLTYRHVYNITSIAKYLKSKPVPRHLSLEFDSCIVSDNQTYETLCKYSAYWRKQPLNLEKLPTSFCGWWRLLEVDNRLILPIKTKIRILVTSSDVIHSWAVPSLGVKIDACPGRLNCVYVYIKRPGVFHGQCSELCGIKHGFMPIVVHAVTKDKYNRWFADNCEIVK